MKPELIEQENWERPSDNALMDIMVFRVPGGILYEMYTNGDRCFHQFSPRPYVLGQSCDGPINTCVFALFYDFCARNCRTVTCPAISAAKIMPLRN